MKEQHRKILEIVRDNPGITVRWIYENYSEEFDGQEEVANLIYHLAKRRELLQADEGQTPRTYRLNDAGAEVLLAQTEENQKPASKSLEQALQKVAKPPVFEDLDDKISALVIVLKFLEKADLWDYRETEQLVRLQADLAKMKGNATAS